tara:strand:+ start:21865 stop:22575 length:711 start_codon:yes stop_codon:yes gene_type:complete
VENSKKKYFAYNENSILISYKNQIDAKLIQEISSSKKNIESNLNKFIFEIVQSINSLLIIFDRSIISSDDLIRELKKIENIENDYINQKKIWQIPVCYDLKFGVDLENLAKEKQLQISEIIKMHKSRTYNVLSMGFMPGFMYLGFINENLSCERKLNPSLNIKKGSIGVALNQTCIYPKDSPGGWHIIGRSPLNFFNLKSNRPSFASPGDKIQFIEISNEQFESMVKKNKTKPKQV